MSKPALTVSILQDEAWQFAELESSHPEPTIFGVTDGKAIGTYLEHKFDAHIERKYVHHTLKEECLWLQECSSPFSLIRELESWIADYNEHSLHSALGYKTPRRFEVDYQPSHSTPFAAA